MLIILRILYRPPASYIPYLDFVHQIQQFHLKLISSICFKKKMKKKKQRT